MTETIALTVAGILFLAGLAGTLLPVLPGPLFIWIGMLLYGLIAGFENTGPGFLMMQALLALCVFGVDYFFSALGTRYFGGSRAALWGAAIGLMFGVLFFPVGLLVGPFAGAAIADLLFRGRAVQALKSGVGASIGFWIALPVKLGLEAVMIIWFILRIKV